MKQERKKNRYRITLFGKVFLFALITFLMILSVTLLLPALPVMSNYKSVTLAEEPFYIFFENESAEIKDSQMFVLDKAVFDTKNNAGKLLYITGNSSLRNKGKYASPEGEHELALLRARKIADYFIENSVPESQIIIMENGSLNFSFSGNKDHVELYIK